MTKYEISAATYYLENLEAQKEGARRRYEEELARIEEKAENYRIALEADKAAKKAARKELKTFGNFRQTNEKIEVTFSGWDGKSYNGEGQNLRVWLSDKHPDKKFVKTAHFGGTIHEVLDERHEKSGILTVSYFWSKER